MGSHSDVINSDSTKLSYLLKVTWEQKPMQNYAPILLATLLCLLTSSTCRADLIVNGSFENVPGTNLGQGFLPADFLQVGNVTPGADTWSNDGSYGVTPGDFGSFVDASAQHGNRFVAGADFGNGGIEAIGHQLATTLTPGFEYEMSGYILDGHAFGTRIGGFELFLSANPDFDDPGRISIGQFGPTDGSFDWQFKSFSFVAPADADSRSFLIFSPFTTVPNREAYVGLDNIRLTVVPEPSAAFLACLGLVGIFGVRRRI